MKIAIIITGDVRECFVKNEIINIFRNYDVFCGSYIRHKNYISNIGLNNFSFLIDEQKDIRLPNGIKKEEIQQNMLQWLHLDNIIKKFKNKLLTYDIILKYRFDYFINDSNFINKILVEPNVLYNHSDIIFYSDSLTFINIFEKYYDNIQHFNFHKNRNINDNSFETSWHSMSALENYLKKYNFISNKLQFPNGNIIRGKYKKELADGNKRLYDKNKLLGKFYK